MGGRTPATYGRGTDRCRRRPGGYDPGLDPRALRSRPLPEPLSSAVTDPCDPAHGKALKYYRVSNRRDLCQRVLTIAGPPIIYQPIAELIGAGDLFGPLSIVVQRVIPNGFTGRYVKVHCGLNEPHYAQAVLWALYLGAGASEIEGDPWQGVINEPEWLPIGRNAEAGDVVSLRAIVHPDFWTVAAQVVNRPVRNLLVAEAVLELFLEASAGCDKDNDDVDREHARA